MKKIYLVNSDFINSRLDRWFRRVVCQVPQSLIEKSIRSGNIKVNNKKEKSSYKLKNQDQIIVRSIFRQRRIYLFHLTYLLKTMKILQ